MKTKTLWINFITHHRKRTWQWKPWFLRSQVIFGRDGRTWLAPHWELGWGPLVFHWTSYNSEKEYKGNYKEHECPAELMQDRINELENAIRVHRDGVTNWDGFDLETNLWKVLRDDR
jgi:hypothetical protein